MTQLAELKIQKLNLEKQLEKIQSIIHKEENTPSVVIGNLLVSEGFTILNIVESPKYIYAYIRSQWRRDFTTVTDELFVLGYRIYGIKEDNGNIYRLWLKPTR